MPGGTDDRRALLSGRVRLPEHVVHREFADETVILNLESGRYHGVNPTAARMIEVLGSGITVNDAIMKLAEEFEQPPEVIEHDLLALCDTLIERGLIVQDVDSNAT